ncbi:MAG: gliding motility-associated C-terminal domain-containing protein [Saprospiraceae bacterium]|nr:gliding motility-associated C-terminal domain-containing protein [Saprospiraceae bacterium]
MFYKPTISALVFIHFCLCQTTITAQNLIKNPDCELPVVGNSIPFWTSVVGNLWNARQIDPLPQSGASYFSPGQVRNAELSQTVDVSDYACSIDAGIQRFLFSGYVYSFNQEPLDIARIVVQYLSATGTILTAYDSGDKTPLGIWEKLTNSTLAPVGTRNIRIRLISSRQSGTDNDANYDNFALTPSPTKVTIDSVLIVGAKCGKPNGKLTVKTSGGSNLSFNITNGIASPDSVFSNLNGGNYTVSVTSGTCTVTKSVILPTTLPPDIDSVKLTPSVCSRPNGKITVFARSNYANLAYSLDSAKFRDGRLFDSLTANTYKVTLRDSLNCTTQQTVTLVDNPPPTISGFKETPSVCGENNGTLTGIVVIGGSSPLNFSIDSIRFSSISTFDSLKSGNYKLVIRDSNGCTASKAFVIQYFDIAKITSVDITPPSCKGGDGLLKVNATSNALPLIFSIDSVRFTSQDMFSNLASGIYSVLVRDTFGCVTKQNVVVPDPKLPIIEEIRSSISECGQATASISVKAKSPVSTVKYGLDSSALQVENTFRNLKKGKYTVVVSDEKGCEVTADYTVQSNCDLFIPNAFSPNGDGQNDYLSIFGNEADIEKILSFRIFNRWGNIVYNDPNIRLNDPTSGWNGKFQDRELPNDVFIYVIVAQMKKGEILEKKGEVLLTK